MLRYIPRQYFANAVRQNNYFIPLSVDTTCPFCKKKANFTLNWSLNKTMVIEHTKSHCPACQQKVLFLYLTKSNEKNNTHTGELFINPAGDTRQALEGIDEAEKLPESIRKAYFSTINVLNAHEWTATSVLCRRVLEGITKSIVSEGQKNKPLASQLKDLPNHINLTEPILTLADAIRKGGNLGAHFDAEKEPTEEISSLMVDVLDYLIEYLFIVPARIQNLHDKIENLSNSK